MAEIKCPIHREALTIIQERLNLHGFVMNCVVGECSLCRCRYIDTRFSPSCSAFALDGTTYMYLDELTRLSEQDKRHMLVRAAISEHSKPSKSSDFNKSGKVSIPSTEFGDDGTVHNAEKLYFSQKLPAKCPNDKSALCEMRYVSFELDGMKLTTHARFCPKCKTVFLTRTEEAKLHNYIIGVQKKSFSKPTSQSMYEYDSIVLKKYRLCKKANCLPLLPNNLFRALQREVSPSSFQRLSRRQKDSAKKMPTVRRALRG